MDWLIIVGITVMLSGLVFDIVHGRKLVWARPSSVRWWYCCLWIATEIAGGVTLLIGMCNT